MKAEQKQRERLQKAKDEKERVKGMTSRGVPKPKNPTSLAALDKQEDQSSSLLGVGVFNSNDETTEPPPKFENFYKAPATAAPTSGIGKGTASITDVKARQHQRLGITPAPAYPGASRGQQPVVGYFQKSQESLNYQAQRSDPPSAPRYQEQSSEEFPPLNLNTHPQQ